MATTFEGRWTHLDKFLLRTSPAAPAGFQPCVELKDFILNSTRILLIGAGGLGCETLKDLALMGFLNIDIIDMDVIDLSNLNRQFLFREKDVGRHKATVAAEFIQKRVPGVTVTAHTCPIQEKPAEFYEQFTLIVCGLDNLEARRWINAMVCSFVEPDESGNAAGGKLIPLIDGGTEAFQGQTMVVLPFTTACFECRMGLFPPATKFPACTLKTNPRIPEHCIIYVKEKIWGDERPDDPLDSDDPAHVQWIVDKSVARAKEFGVQTDPITFQFTQGVIKNTIPAIASTNALVSAQCAMEVFKVATMCAESLMDQSLFIGDSGVGVRAWKNERNPDCPVCSGGKKTLEISKATTLADLCETFTSSPPFLLQNPSIIAPGAGKDGKSKSLWIPKPKMLADSTRPNLEKAISDLVPNQTELMVNGDNLPNSPWRVVVSFTDE